MAILRLKITGSSVLGPGFAGVFVVRDASDPVLPPHLAEELRTVALPVENQRETTAMRVLAQFRLRGLCRNVSEQAGHNAGKAHSTPP